MASKKITMVDHTQIAKKGYKGCKSTQSVKNFCAKNKSSIDCCWYKPKGASQKVLLIEMSSFRDCWKASQKSTTMKASTGSKTATKGRTRKTSTTKLSAKTTTRRTTTGRTRTATQSRTRTTRLRRAA